MLHYQKSSIGTQSDCKDVVLQLDFTIGQYQGFTLHHGIESVRNDNRHSLITNDNDK